MRTSQLKTCCKNHRFLRGAYRAANNIANVAANNNANVSGCNVVSFNINDLNDRDRDIIIRRHGLAGEREMTFMEIGKIYDRSSESIRQRYHSVIMSLRFNMTKQTKGKADINSVSQFF